MPDPVYYETFASVLKHSEGGMTQKDIRGLAKSVGVRVKVYPGHYVGHHAVDIESGATKTQRKKLLKLLGLDYCAKTL